MQSPEIVATTYRNLDHEKGSVLKEDSCWLNYDQQNSCIEKKNIIRPNMNVIMLIRLILTFSMFGGT